MDTDPIIVHIEQPELEELNKTDLNNSGTLPVIWEALESLTSPDMMKRITGLDRIIKLDAVYHYPLVVYVLMTRITEPDIELRTRIVKLLANILDVKLGGAKQPPSASSEVKQSLMTVLSGLRTRQIFALLQATEFDKTADEAVTTLLSYCSFAGGHLAQILSNRAAPITIRRQAANFIGRIGYLDALPALERMVSRLENRREDDDAGILIGLRETIKLLYTP